jgi:hypothetical protein
MIDGIKIRTSIDNLAQWLELTRIQTWTSTDNNTGELKSRKRENQMVIKRRANWDQYHLDIIEVIDLNTSLVNYYLNIRGSFHKNNFNGENWDEFNWDALQNQISHLCISLFIEPEKARISGLEFGVNIVTPFTVSHFLNNYIIDYKGREFNNYRRDTNGLELGLYCEFNQYSIKLYDKGKQYDLPYNLMRFEKKFIKMQVLNKKDIIHLSDLFDKHKVYNLKPMLLRAWDDILIREIVNEENLSKKIKNKEYILILNGKSVKYWQQLKEKNVAQYNYNRRKYRKIVNELGPNYHSLVRTKISETWDKLFENSTNLPIGNSENLNEFTIKIKGNIIKSITDYCFPSICDGPAIVKYNKKQLYAI